MAPLYKGRDYTAASQCKLGDRNVDTVVVVVVILLHVIGKEVKIA